MSQPILYLGDTSRDTAAAYLLSLLAHWQWECEYVPSDVPLSQSQLAMDPVLFVLSDYPAARISRDLQAEMVARVTSGAGLLMIGGWESFHGMGGNWDGTPIGDVLPVEIESVDDRRNCDHPVLIRDVAPHPIVDGLPWDSRPPLIGGYNRVVAKSAATLLLEAVTVSVQRTAETFRFMQEPAADPLLVVGECGRGRTGCFMTDVAPHWVGPLVDWGPHRVSAALDEVVAVEVGNLYAAFLEQLLGWMSGRS